MLKKNANVTVYINKKTPNTLQPFKRKQREFCEKIRSFYDSGFVKTCDELVIDVQFNEK